MEIILFAAAALLVFANGANDNFKGFATVWGANETNYRTALVASTVATIFGVVAAAWWSTELVASFSGRGLVTPSVAGSLVFMSAVATGAGATVLLATLIGFPISTTHALIGALSGAGFLADKVNWSKLGSGFLLPLLLSPILALVLVTVMLRLSQAYRGRRSIGVKAAAEKAASDNSLCACIEPAEEPSKLMVLSASSTNLSTANAARAARIVPHLIVSTSADCQQQGAIPLVSVNTSTLLTRLHITSASAICFARGLNDAPKLAALMIAAKLSGVTNTFLLIAVAMTIGGLLLSRKVATTMAQHLTPLSQAQGTAANFVTASLVIAASLLGLPVSTTHVSVGSIAAAGWHTSSLNWGTLRNVLLSWLVTLPLAAALSALTYTLIKAILGA